MNDILIFKIGFLLLFLVTVLELRSVEKKMQERLRIISGHLDELDYRVKIVYDRLWELENTAPKLKRDKTGR